MWPCILRGYGRTQWGVKGRGGEGREGEGKKGPFTEYFVPISLWLLSLGWSSE